MNDVLKNSLFSLLDHFNVHGYSGYDPYDTLNMSVPLRKLGKWIPAIAIQIQKRNPVNIRPLLGIKKGHNPKAMGLFLKSYCILYRKTNEEIYRRQADWLYEWLAENFTPGYSGKCWGYNFDWANPERYLPAYTPSVVVTSFVVDGIFEYWKITGNQDAGETILSAADFVLKDIPVQKFQEGISFSYTDKHKDVCYNASLLAAEILAKSNVIEANRQKTSLIKAAVDLVVSRQKASGAWYYSWDPDKDTERYQIDFHQGFVLVSLHNLSELIQDIEPHVSDAIIKGLCFYRNNQFLDTGRSMWRLPRKWPVDIHNQSQGIITFNKLKGYDKTYNEFATKIALWTIENMQAHKGYFYYRISPFFKNKINYVRWSQAWMLLALSELCDDF